MDRSEFSSIIIHFQLILETKDLLKYEFLFFKILNVFIGKNVYIRFWDKKTFTLLDEGVNRLVGEGAAARGPGKPGEYTKQVNIYIIRLI